MVASQISGTVGGSWASADRQPETASFHHAYRVVEVAKNELELLTKQRRLLNRKVKLAKRAIEGLKILFGKSRINDRGPMCMCGGHATAIDASETLPRAENARTVRKLNAELAPFNRVPKNKALKLKLERACRIALLESEESATATEIYDRITRRRSYQLNRYKHPLAQVIATLSLLAERGEIETQAKGDVQHWWWNRGAEKVENEFEDTGFSLQNDVGATNRPSDHRLRYAVSPVTGSITKFAG